MREGTLRSTAAAEAALADREASVLALHEEFFVGHDRLVRMLLPAMRHIGLIVGDADHQTRGAYRPFLQRHDVRQGSLPGWSRAGRPRSPRASDRPAPGVWRRHRKRSSPAPPRRPARTMWRRHNR